MWQAVILLVLIIGAPLWLISKLQSGSLDGGSVLITAGLFVFAVAVAWARWQKLRAEANRQAFWRDLNK